MNAKARLMIPALIALASACAFAKGGGGGILVERQEPAWDFSPLPAADSSFQATTIGGFGYAILDEGTMIGGFGQISLDLSVEEPYSSSSASSGGSKVYYAPFGGLILGQSIGGAGIRLNIACKLGMGFVERLSGISEGGFYACWLANPYLELSLPLARWLRLSAALGYQYISAIGGIGAEAGSDQLTSAYDAGTPTIGVGLSFGK